jgi:iron complex outermembrane receptor protein
VALLKESNETLDSDGLLYHITAGYQLPFIQGFSLHAGYFSKTYTFQYKNRKALDEGWITWQSTDPGEALIENAEYTRHSLDASLNYKIHIKKIKSTLEFTAGYMWQENDERIEGFSETENSLDTNQIGYYNMYYYSLFTNVHFNFKGLLELQASVNNDALSYYAVKNRSRWFPGFVAILHLKQLDFMKKIQRVNRLTLKGGYGESSNTRSLLSYQMSGNEISINPELAMPVNYETFIGLDFGFFSNRLTGGIELYDKESTQFHILVPVPNGTSLANCLLTNAGKIQNKGIELSLKGIIINHKNFKWNAGINISRSYNEIKKLVEGQDDYIKLTGVIHGGVGNTIMAMQAGQTINSFYAYRQIYDESGEPIEGLYEDINQDGVIDNDDLVFVNSSLPDIVGSLYTQLTYKNLSFYMAGRMWLGNNVYNNASSTMDATSFLSSPFGYLRNISSDADFEQPQYLSDHYIEEADFFKIDEITLSYDIPGEIAHSTKISVYASLQNAFTFTSYSGPDPEILSGIDYYRYPVTRKILLGIKARFK